MSFCSDGRLFNAYIMSDNVLATPNCSSLLPYNNKKIIIPNNYIVPPSVQQHTTCTVQFSLAIPLDHHLLDICSSYAPNIDSQHMRRSIVILLCRNIPCAGVLVLLNKTNKLINKQDTRTHAILYNTRIKHL
jgi:hypothetical protein